MTKKSQSKRKSRIPHLGLDFGRSQTIAGLRSNADGSFTMFGEDGKPLSVASAYTGLVYERPQGHKVTVQVPDSGDAVGSVRRAIDNFDRIVGVDTNYRSHGGKVICATAVVELSKVRYSGDRWTAKADPLWGFEFHNPTKDPERIGWLHALATGRRHNGWLNAGANFLLVVDAHLDDLPQINQRKSPVLDNEVLPAGVQLGYASADTTDSALNGLIARCDSLAKQLLVHVIKTPECAIDPLLRGVRTPFSEYRYWKFDML